MKLVTAFGPHLYFDNNSSQDLLNSLPNKGLIKKILPVNYFKRSILRPVKKYKPDVLICFGLDENKKIPVFETIAKNEMITIKNLAINDEVCFETKHAKKTSLFFDTQKNNYFLCAEKYVFIACSKRVSF